MNKPNTNSTNKQPLIMIVLGAPNDDNGSLLPVALSRAEAAIKEYFKHKNIKIILTGGFGEHFNKTDKPHAFYLQKFLLSHGIPSDDIIDQLESSNTIEDAILCQSALSKLKTNSIIIITSDFHLERAKLIFSFFLSKYNLTFIGASANLPKAEMDKLKQHEKEAMEAIWKQGGISAPVQIEEL